jgi:mRNA-degrading endonuclease RelE of RelBE toxin-antitoxin system
MQITMSKQAIKYLDRCDAKTYAKLKSAIDGLYDFYGDIAKLQGRKDEYRLKKPPYRVIFVHKSGSNDIYIKAIHPRGDAYKKG